MCSGREEEPACCHRNFGQLYLDQHSHPSCTYPPNIILTITLSHYHLHHRILPLSSSPSHPRPPTITLPLSLIVTFHYHPHTITDVIFTVITCKVVLWNRQNQLVRVYVFTITIVQCTLMLPFYVGTFTVLSQGTPLLYILITFSVTFSMLYAHTMYIIAITMTVLILLSARHQSGGDAYTGGLWSKMAAAVWWYM